MIGLELAKKIGATHYTTNTYGDKVLCRIKSRKIQYNYGAKWADSDAADVLLSTIEKINFNPEPSIETLQASLDRSQLKVMELTEQLAVSVENYNNMKSRLLREEKQPKRTKVEYVKCDESNKDIARAMLDGETFYSEDGSYSFGWADGLFRNQDGANIGITGSFYRRTEVEIDISDAIAEWGHKNKIGIFSPQRFKFDHLLESNRDKAIEMCHLVAELTDKPQ